jgi:hypothetical protein
MTRLLLRNPSNYVMWIILFWIFVNCLCLSHLFLFYDDETRPRSHECQVPPMLIGVGIATDLVLSGRGIVNPAA